MSGDTTMIRLLPILIAAHVTAGAARPKSMIIIPATSANLVSRKPQTAPVVKPKSEVSMSQLSKRFVIDAEKPYVANVSFQRRCMTVSWTSLIASRAHSRAMNGNGNAVPSVIHSPNTVVRNVMLRHVVVSI